MIKIVETAGPFGDETCNYDIVVTKQGVTIRDFVDYIINERKGDWGYININGERLFEYRWGEVISDNIHDSVKDRTLPDMKANGGWSRMDYNISI